MKLFVIVLNYNGGEKILDCLRALYLIKQPQNWQVNILVIDNGSTDNSVESVNELFINEFKKNQPVNSLTRNKMKPLRPWKGGVSLQQEKSPPSADRLRFLLHSSPPQDRRGILKREIIINKRNFGFAGGMNIGIKYALKNGAEAVLLLNQDTEVKKDFLEPLITNMADITGPVIKFKREGSWIYDFGGRVNLWVGRSYHLEFSHPGWWQAEVETSTEAITPPRCIFPDYVSGCAMLIRKPVLEKIGLFDERYFLYFEDADFCLRAKKAGFKIAVEPKSIVMHYLSPTEKKPFWQNWQLLKSNLIFINQWVPIFCRPIAYVYWLLLAGKILL